MKQDQIATASPVSQGQQDGCRGTVSERKSGARLVVESSACKQIVHREYRAPWVPRKGVFISVENGWGQHVRAEVMVVPSGPQPLHSFGVRLFAHQQDGPWHWVSMATRGVLWWEGA